MTFSLIAFCGGTAMLSAVEVLGKVANQITLIVPVSDDGGSSGKIVRVLRGPAVGDCRSAISRLGAAAGNAPAPLVRLLGYRLPQDDKKAALEWLDILQGVHPIWKGMPDEFTIIVTRFLLYFNNSIMRPSPSKPLFTFSNGSLGNFFLTGARLYFGHLDSGLFLLARLWHLPYGFKVLPCSWEGDKSLTLGIEFHDSTINKILGQNTISHPTDNSSPDQVDKNGSGEEALPGQVKRVFFVDGESKKEVIPKSHPGILTALKSGDHSMIIYGRGSLLTSIVPCINFKEITREIQKLSIPKILIVNGSADRETTHQTKNGIHIMTCDDVISFILSQVSIPIRDYYSYITHVIVPSVGGLVVENNFKKTFPEIEVVRIDAEITQRGVAHYDDQKLVSYLMKLNSSSKFLEGGNKSHL